MQYYQIQPHPILSPFIQCYWVARDEALTRPTSDHGIIPGGYVDLVFNLGDQVCVSDSDDIFFARGRSFVVGPFDCFQRFQVRGQFEFFGVRFHLGKSPFFSQLPLGEARNRAIPLDAVWKDERVRELELHLAQVSGIIECVTCVEAFLMKVLRSWKQPDAVVPQAVSLIEEAKGQISVEALSSSLGVSSRQLERKFTQHLGLSPKAFCRVTRFRQVKLLLENFGETSGCDLAYACGYYDQTHLIREFRLFTGHTPARYERIQPVGFFLYDSPSHC